LNDCRTAGWLRYKCGGLCRRDLHKICSAKARVCANTLRAPLVVLAVGCVCVGLLLQQPAWCQRRHLCW
jgi:hypothetical protein